VRFAQITIDSPLYAQETQLRHDLLRVPLGLSLTAEDTEGDASQLHYVILDGERVVGCVLMKPIAGGTVKLRQMVLIDELRGQGLGQKLIAYAEDAVRALGYERVQADARVVAQRFYEKQGYSTEGDVFVQLTIPHIRMVKTL